MLAQKAGLILLVICLGLLGHITVADQMLCETLMRERIVTPNIYMRHWNIQDIGGTIEVTQFSYPWTIVYPITSKFTLDIESGYMHSSIKNNSADQQDTKLFGFTDTKIRGIYAIADDQFMLRAGLNLNSGENKVSAERHKISGTLEENALGFGIDQIGEGFGFNIGTGFAREVGSFVLGGGIGYLIKSSYEPFEDADNLKYSPGNELRFVGGADLDVKNNLLRADVIYVRFGDSSRTDLGSFESDGKLCAEFSWRSATIKGRTVAQVFVRDTLPRSEFPESTAFYRVVLPEENPDHLKRSHGNQLDIQSLAHFQIRSNLGLQISLEGKYIGENEEDIGDAVILGVGAGVTWRIIRHLRLDISAKYLDGRMDDDVMYDEMGDKEIDLYGIAFTGSLRTEF